MQPMILVFLLGALAAATQTSQKPTVQTLEAALRASSSDQFGASSLTKRASPAEIFLELPTQSVPDHLLVAVLISGATGGRDPVEVAKTLLADAPGLDKISHGTFHSRIKGLGRASQARLTAAHELSRRAALRERPPQVIRSPTDAWKVLRNVSAGDDEILSALFLNQRGRVLSVRELGKGGPTLAVVDPRVVFREALSIGASGIIMAHHHPSGSPEPSIMDLDVTKRIQDGALLLGLKLLDHLIITPTEFTSLQEKGLMG